ncbi:MAG: hypothetical protein ACM3SS_04200, partial [Rhodospirillaceae bacterium]
SVLRMRVEDASGKRVADAEQKSMLIEPLTLEQWEALGESAAYKMIEPLRNLMRDVATSEQLTPLAQSGTANAMAARSGAP